MVSFVCILKQSLNLDVLENTTCKCEIQESIHKYQTKIESNLIRKWYCLV